MEKEHIFTNEGTGIPQAWNSIFGMGIQDSEMNCSSEQPPNCYFNPNCVNSMDQRDPFESAFVSSPANSHPGGESIVLRELIGRLGSISSSSNNSCYNTPLNSPPKLHMSRFSSFGGKNELTHVMESGKLSRVSSNQSFMTAGSQFTRIPEENKKLGDSTEESSVSETGVRIKGESSNTNARKRKGKETQSCTTTTICAKDDKVVAEDAKRSKLNEEKTPSEESTEPPKDYIHVRARRGQATDSHSLAERVRREKIGERMKFLQDLVPGCNKVTGKAVMLDEIINYVQSLQRQVEFLSMKLATVNPRMDASMDTLLSKDMFRPQVSVPNNVNPFNTSVQTFPYGFQAQINGMVPDRPENQFSMNPLVTAMHRSSVIKPSHIDGFGEASTFWENDLQSVVKMALGLDQPHGFLGQMKVEL